MKPPISYYGGKQRLASKIIPLIPPHTVYVEPFAGGAAILFNKPWPDVTNAIHYREVINDIDGHLINFYRQLRDNGEALCRLIELTPFSRAEHKTAKRLDEGDDLERARRYFTIIQQSFGHGLNNGWRFATCNENDGATWVNKTSRLFEYISRMKSIYIENLDALQCIKKWDSPQTLFYCDPPYVGTRQDGYPGGRKGYALNDFQNLIDALDNIDGSFLLSHYATDAKIPSSWERFEFSATCSTSRINRHKKRTEIVYRKITTKPLRPELQKLFNAGKFDCFKGVNLMAEITIKVPIGDPRALNAAAKMLLDLAGNISEREAVPPVPVEAPAPAPVPVEAPAPAPVPVEAVAPVPVEAHPVVVEAVEYVTRAKTDEVWPQERDGVFYDRAGFPWDSRIHSTPPKCTKRSGNWRTKRGRDESIVAGVEEQLKTRFGAHDPKNWAPAPVEAAPPPKPAPVEAAPPPPPPVESVDMTFPEFMKWIAKQDPVFTDTRGLNKLCEHVGLPSIGLLAVHPTRIPELVRYVQAGGR